MTAGSAAGDALCRTGDGLRSRADEETADAIERAVWEEKKLPSNNDWSMSRLLHYLGLPRELYLPIFAAAASSWGGAPT